MGRVSILTALALVAFAANSILCRLALGSHSVDPLSFTAIRIVAGAAMLWLLLGAKSSRIKGGTPASAAMLFLYAVAFSLAYQRLTAATGALILFGTVQATMFSAGLIAGERPKPLEWLGWTIALAGLVVLLFPGLSAPTPLAALQMFVAGAAWGIYSLRGRLAKDAFSTTAHNFALAVPFAVVPLLISPMNLHANGSGVALAITSGAITSGLGYVLWYAALPSLGSIRAAMVQLAVPVVAATGGIALLHEQWSLRFLLAALLTIGGIAVATVLRRK